MIAIHPHIAPSVTTLAEVIAGPARQRTHTLHQRKPARITAACRRKEHYRCYSINCVCPCGHGGPGRSRR